MSDITIANIVSAFIARHGLLDKCHTYLVALSGGADSVALLLLLLELGYDVEGVHCNFHLRGEESDRDESFVKQLCSIKNVPLHLVHFETREYASLHKISIEMAARQLRYAYFEQLRNDINADAICVAHHRNDNVETVIMNLLRGTGIHGLAGIKPRNGRIVRPLLCVSRSEIENYLEVIGQDYVTDSTNLEDIYTRNKIRLDIIPLFKQINPSFCESVFETAQRLADVAAIYRQAINSSIERVMVSPDGMSIEKLLCEVSPQAVLYEWLSPFGFNSSQIKDVMRSLKSTSGKMFFSNDWALLRDREQLLLRERNAGEEDYRLNVRMFSVGAGFEVPKCNNIAYIDADKLCGELKLRKWKSGDKFVPFGMKGFKKVRDYLRDRKLSLFEKENVMVVTSGEEIVWLVNERTDNRFRIDSKTVNVVEIEVLSSK